MPTQASQKEIRYAGFWLRLAAFLLDYIILLSSLMLLMPLLVKGFFMVQPDHAVQFSGVVDGIAIISFWLYFALWESSVKQATIGKMLLGLKVVDAQGGRISFMRATGRHLVKFLSALILMLGFIMIAFSQHKQGLHDLLAKTYVKSVD